jgi:hypothetical protein
MQRSVNNAQKNVDKCFMDKCKHLEKHYKHMNLCNKKKFPEKCYIKRGLTNQIMDDVNLCLDKECSDKVDNLREQRSLLMYSKKPHGKEIVKNKKKINQLEEEKEKCKMQKCSYIYPIDKFKEENIECQKLLTLSIKKNNKYQKCVKKHNLEEKNAKIYKCTQKKCGHLIKYQDILMTKNSKLLNKSLLKSQIKSQKTKSKKNIKKYKLTKKNGGTRLTKLELNALMRDIQRSNMPNDNEPNNAPPTPPQAQKK